MADPFKIDGQACISFSGGRTSAYMLWRILQAHGGKLPAEAVVAFANTGKEDPRTLDFVQKCSDAWGVAIWWVEYSDNEVSFRNVEREYASENGEPFSALIAKKKYLPNAVTRFCTSDLKIKPINAMLKHWGWGEYDMIVGIRADEPRRVAKMPHLHKPLAIAGVSKQDVLAFWKAQPFDLMAEDGNCDLCFNKGLHQIMSSVRKRPEKAIWWAREEKNVGATFAKDRPSYEQMYQNALAQTDAFGYENEEAIACFCGD
ncbi:phosphoadenosine phosphosulfate reductase family protein [Variovorax sp. GT1P44]|uniref:phosphoadenosine phosphosulfate reductase domain-containing protein n=1 Tax=Variovorax sp. GT1P44 TaxID=3443742 RepID=UPI003F450408